MKYIIGLLAVLSIQISLAESSMPKVLEQEPGSVCKSVLIDAAAQVIEFREHRLVLTSSTQQGATQVVGYQSYNDRDMQLSFFASENSDGKCLLSIEKIFVINEPCIVTREEVFRKWQYLGKLAQDNSNFVLQSHRNADENAYLTEINSEKGSRSMCQILKKTVSTLPLDKSE